MHNDDIPIAAATLRARNEINMVISQNANLHFPIDRLQVQPDKVIADIHGEKFEWKPDFLVAVRSSSLFREQKRLLFGLEQIRRIDDSRKNKMVTRTYEAPGKDGHMVLERNTKLKIIRVVLWPDWMPRLDVHLRHGIEFSKTWYGAERIISAITGAALHSGSKHHDHETVGLDAAALKHLERVARQEEKRELQEDRYWS